MNIEITVLTAFIAGFFGSTHCIGMCGSIVVLLETSMSVASRPHAWLRRGLYNIGRLGFYLLLGTIAGAGGAVLTQTAGLSTGLITLRLLAAALVILVGLNLLFDWHATRFLETAGAGLWRRVSGFAKFVLPANTAARALAAGFLWGALPCGLVYSAVAMSASSGTVSGGATIMLAFWLGTVPALLAVGASAGRLQQLRSNRTLRRVAGLLVILLGLAALVPIANPAAGHAHHSAVLSHDSKALHL